MFGACSSIALPREAHEKVAMASEVAESIPFRLSGSSALVEGGAPKAADGSFLLGLLC